MSDKRCIHDGHRARLKRRFMLTGCTGMNEHEILELLLTYAIPRRDVNPLAHELIDKYGSLENVITESPASLQGNPGISEHTAVLLHLFGEAVKGGLFAADSSKKQRLPNLLTTLEFCSALFRGGRNERACVLLLDSKNNIIDRYFESGDRISAPLGLRRLVSRAALCCASGVVLAHSHPSGKAAASYADREIAKTVGPLLASIGAELREVVIVTDSDAYALLHDVALSRFRSEDGEAASNCAGSDGSVEIMDYVPGMISGGKW